MSRSRTALFAVALSACAANGLRFLPESGVYEDTAAEQLEDGGWQDARERYLVVRDPETGSVVTVYGNCGAEADAGTQVRLTVRGGDGGWILDDGKVDFPLGVAAGDSWTEAMSEPACIAVATASSVSSTSLTIRLTVKCPRFEFDYGEERWEINRGRVTFVFGPGSELRTRRIGPLPLDGRCPRQFGPRITAGSNNGQNARKENAE